MKEKTLKDLARVHEGISEMDLKEETINWVKEDIELIKNELPYGVARQLVNRWIKRLDITESDLEEK